MCAWQQWSIEHLLNKTSDRIVDVYQTNQTFHNTTQYLLGFNEPNKMCAQRCLGLYTCGYRAACSSTACGPRWPRSGTLCRAILGLAGLTVKLLLQGPVHDLGGDGGRQLAADGKGALPYSARSLYGGGGGSHPLSEEDVCAGGQALWSGSSPPRYHPPVAAPSASSVIPSAGARNRGWHSQLFRSQRFQRLCLGARSSACSFP